MTRSCETYFKYFSIFSLLSKSGQVEKVEGSAVENSATCSALLWMSKSPRLKAWKFGSVITVILQAQPNNKIINS